MSKTKKYTIYLLTFIFVWVGLDFLFSILRSAVFVFMKTFKTALYSGLISLILIEIFDRGSNGPKFKA